MLRDLYIVITDTNGDMVLGIREDIGPVALKSPTSSLLRLLNDEVLIKGLIDNAKDIIALKKELE
jgi:hypothetical protein